MLVNLYTVRVVLETLGAEDYGIFNVVGGVVVLFTFLNSTMTSATQRFLNFALGRNDAEQVRNVYSASLIVHAAIAVLVVVLAQTVGLWFFHTWLNIPPDRQTAAFVVYQLSVVTTAIGILQVSYRATIIAHERMSFFAMLSVIEAALLLGVVLLLPIVVFDKLIIYAFLVCVTRAFIFIIHKVYCNRTFEIARFQYCRDKDLFRQLLGFAGWNFFGSLANVSRSQGTNMLVNIFHGVIVNAAIGIATQVNTAVYQLVSNFQTAFKPQIIKSYSAKDYKYFMQLIFRTSKVSFCLLFFFVLPLYINADFVLRIWLGSVPEYTVVFVQLILISSLINAMAGPLWMSVHATGDIKRHEIIAGCFLFANLPLSLLLLWMGFSPVWILFIRIGLDVLLLSWRVFFLGGRINLPVNGFFREVLMPMFIVAALATLITVFLKNLFITGWGRLIVSSIVSTVSIGFLMYLIGLTKWERFFFKNWINAKLRAKKQ